MKFLFTGLSAELTVGLFLFIGMCVGSVLVRWIIRLTELESEATGSIDASEDPQVCWWHFMPLLGHLLSHGRRLYRGQPMGDWGLLVEVGTGVLFAAFVVAMLQLRSQQTSEVRPDEAWRYARIGYHLLLISLLVAASGTDCRAYVVPDRITLSGTLIALLLATASGQLQMIHLWVDWNDPLVELYGPYLPDWIKQHQHLHGLAWSAVGFISGAGITWLVRAVSRLLLGREALGFGDVTLMGMIGSFVGWQPVIFVFLLAPLCGLMVGLSIRWFSAREFVPYGPYLSTAAVIVLFSWKWLWLPTRTIFGDPQSLAILGGISLCALVVLLGLLRLYRAIPVDQRLSQRTAASCEPSLIEEQPWQPSNAETGLSKSDAGRQTATEIRKHLERPPETAGQDAAADSND